MVMDGADLAAWRENECSLDYSRLAAFVEKGNEGLADRELRERVFGIEPRILSKRRGSGANRLLIARREGTKSVLDAISQLAENVVRQIPWILADEENSHAL